MLSKSLRTTTRGFTLIELMLAMAFFSAILAIGATTFVQVLSIYNKGLAVKQMNQAGRTLTDNLIRNANQGASNIFIQPSTGVNTARCITLGDTMYLLSYYNETSATTTAYRFSGTSQPVNFVRYNIPNRVCPPTTTLINPADVSPVIGSTLRVYYTDISSISNERNLLRFKLVLGTYTGGGPSQDPTVVGANAVCPVSSFGDFCATSNYETVLFLSNHQGGSQ